MNNVLTSNEIKTFKKYCSVMKKYDENENLNFHSENVVLLAKNFGTSTELKQAKQIVKSHNEIGYMPEWLYNERKSLHDSLYAKMNQQFIELGN